MADQKAQDMVNKLMVDGFQHTSPATGSASDPVVDTPMVLTLDQLRPYDLSPRVTRNPLYDDIKASIRERGLDAAPAVTRRPGEPHYMIRSGGNTRLAILRELWSETRDERFLRIACLPVCEKRYTPSKPNASSSTCKSACCTHWHGRPKNAVAN